MNYNLILIKGEVVSIRLIVIDNIARNACSCLSEINVFGTRVVDTNNRIEHSISYTLRIARLNAVPGACSGHVLHVRLT